MYLNKIRYLTAINQIGRIIMAVVCVVGNLYELREVKEEYICEKAEQDL